jgi:hypothetical protein
MYLPLTKVLSIYDQLCVAKLSKKAIKLSVYTLKLGMVDEDMDADKKYAEDFHSICHIFNKNHKTDILVDDLDVYKWIKQVRNGKLSFTGKLKIEVIIKVE